MFQVAINRERERLVCPADGQRTTHFAKMRYSNRTLLKKSRVNIWTSTHGQGGDTKVTKPLSIQIEMKKKNWGCETDARLNAFIDFLLFHIPSLNRWFTCTGWQYRIFFIIIITLRSRWNIAVAFCSAALVCCRPSVATLFFLFENRGPTPSRMYLMNIFSSGPWLYGRGGKKSGWKSTSSVECAIAQNAEGDDQQFRLNVELLE